MEALEEQDKVEKSCNTERSCNERTRVTQWTGDEYRHKYWDGTEKASALLERKQIDRAISNCVNEAQ